MIGPLLSYIWFYNKERNLGGNPQPLVVNIIEGNSCALLQMLLWHLCLHLSSGLKSWQPQCGRSELHSLTLCVFYSLIQPANTCCIRPDIQPSTRGLRLNNHLPSRSQHQRGKWRVNYNTAFYFSFLWSPFLSDWSYISNSDRFLGTLLQPLWWVPM